VTFASSVMHGIRTAISLAILAGVSFFAFAAWAARSREGWPPGFHAEDAVAGV
jgi:uncharacterized membrane protein